MKKTAIICEINPYHKGHRYIFDCGRAESDLVIAVMSGNFTQRSIPAVFDKYTRAGLLVTPEKDGVPSAADLVVELPFPWCSSGTESFAFGGTAIALAMGADSLVCGSEIGDTDTIRRASEAKNSHEYLRRLLSYERETSKGEGSAAVTDRVMRELGFTLGANDKLAAEYLRCIGSRAQFRVFPRISGADTPYQSASNLREMIYSGRTESTMPYVPHSAYEVYERMADSAVKPTRYYELAYTFCRLFADRNRRFAEGGGGLWERILSVAASTRDSSAFFREVGTKKYTDARIRRAILFAMLGVTTEMLAAKPPFTVLLAANGRGRAYLGELRKQSSFPIITKPADVPEDLQEQYSLHIAADRLYTMCMDPPEHSDYYIKKHPVILP